MQYLSVGEYYHRLKTNKNGLNGEILVVLERVVHDSVIG